MLLFYFILFYVSFSLLNPDNNGWYAPAVGIGATGEAGFTTYPDACKFLNKVGSTLVWDEHYEVPYSYLGSEWISFESLDSVKHKVCDNTFIFVC